MDDLIRRQDAIEAIQKIEEVYFNNLPTLLDKASVQRELMMLPSAQPDTDEWCTDCWEYDKVNHCCPRFNRVIRKTVEDLKKECKTGRWIEEHIDITDKEHPKSFRFYRCSACGHVAAPALFVDKEKWLSYCPHCGAFMGGEQDGNMPD